MLKTHQVIKGSVMSEKAVTLSSNEKPTYVLKVDRKATKADVRTALKAVFNVDAVEVNTLIVRGKVVRRALSKKAGAIHVKLPNFKKAYVQLKEGQTLPVATAATAAE